MRVSTHCRNSPYAVKHSTGNGMNKNLKPARMSNIREKLANNGPIKVNPEFSLSFLGFSFSGLDPIFFSDFKPEIHIIFQFQCFLISQQLLIISLWFPIRLSSQTQGFELFFSQLITALWISNLKSG